MNLAHTDTTRLFMYALYDKPKDYPNRYVLRRSFCVRGKIVAWLSYPNDIFLEYNVDVIHTIMRRNGFTWLTRDPGDDPKIMGVYL